LGIDRRTHLEGEEGEYKGRKTGAVY
jgi:hypothetical protein